MKKPLGTFKFATVILSLSDLPDINNRIFLLSMSSCRPSLYLTIFNVSELFTVSFTSFSDDKRNLSVTSSPDDEEEDAARGELVLPAAVAAADNPLSADVTSASALSDDRFVGALKQYGGMT